MASNAIFFRRHLHEWIKKGVSSFFFDFRLVVKVFMQCREIKAGIVPYVLLFLANNSVKKKKG